MGIFSAATGGDSGSMENRLVHIQFAGTNGVNELTRVAPHMGYYLVIPLET